MPSTARKIVALLLFDGVEVLDFAGPYEVFSAADELNGQRAFNVVTVSPSRATVRAVNGLKIVPDYTLEDCPQPDVLIVPGGIGTRILLEKPLLIEWLQRRSRQAEIVASVCTGALLLGKASLLDGLRVTTHHACAELLRSTAPRAHVELSERFHDQGKFCTSAGISAGIDLSLHLVARLLGPDAADATARHMEYERRS